MEEEIIWIENTLNKNARDKAIHKVLSVDKKSAVPEGNNDCSAVNNVTLDVILCSGRKTRITLIVKKSHEVEEKAEMLNDFLFFKGEIMMYSNVLPKYEQLMNDYQDSNDKLWCSLIGYKPYNLIVFEDLKEKKFKMADRIAMLDKTHALLVLHSLGRFHAMGYALIQKGLICKGELNPYYLEIDSPHILNFVSGGLQQLCNVIINDWSSEWKEVGDRLSKRRNVFVEKLKNFFLITEDSFVTVCHGDCWTCNLMFKYCPYDENIPIAVKFVDFQCSHVNSYAFDIILFLFISVKPDVRRTHWNELITEYQKSLASTLSRYGLEEKAPTLEHIEAEIKRLQFYVMLVYLINQPVTKAEIENPFDMEKLKTDYNCMDAFNPKIFNTENYKSAVDYELKKWFDEEAF